MNRLNYQINVPSILRIKPRALNKLGKYLRNSKLKNIVILWGEGIKELFSENILISLDSSEIRIESEICISEIDVDKVIDNSFQLPNAVQAIVAIGGGKTIDYGKYMSFILHLPLISVPTSISNDAICSPMASIDYNGKKKSMIAKMPFGIIIDTEIIKDSPKKFIFSGIGDLISNITAIRDWKLSAKQSNSEINDFAALISLNAVDNFMNYRNQETEDLEFLKLICGSLVMNGIAMEISNSSRPSSGSEHLISHAYDRVASKPYLHGIQVGISTYAISYIQDNKHERIKETLMNCGFFDFVYENPLSKKDYIEAVKNSLSVKENFFTILSYKGNIEKLLDFIENDEIMKKLLK